MPPKFQLPQALFDEAEEIHQQERNFVANGMMNNNNNPHALLLGNFMNSNNNDNEDNNDFNFDENNNNNNNNNNTMLSPESVDQVAMIQSKDHPTQVREISVALVREFLGAHRRELHDSALESFEAAVPRDPRGLNKRSAIARLVNLDGITNSNNQLAMLSSENTTSSNTNTNNNTLTSSGFLPLTARTTSTSSAAFDELEAPPNVSILERLVSAILLREQHQNAVPMGQDAYPHDNNNNNNNFGDDNDSMSYLGNNANNNPSMNFGFNDNGVEINGFSVGSTGALNGGGQFSVFSLADLSREDAVVIGQGAGGRVLRMRHNVTDEYYAVKEIVVGSAQTINEIRREISVLWGTSRNHDDLPSPFLITCHGIFYEQGILYIVMDLMACSLKDALDAHGSFSEVHLRAMFFQVLHGLHYLHHTKRQLHRDIKPHNILISDMGSVKISDFGIASERVQTLHHNARQTFCGTLSYMSPGRAEGLPYSFEADLWGVGMSLYQLAVGELPEGSRSVFAIAEFRQNPPRLPPSVVSTTASKSSVNNNNNSTTNNSSSNNNTATSLKVSSAPAGKKSSNGEQQTTIVSFSKDFQDFVALCLQPEVTHQITVKDLLCHPWMRGMTLERSQRLSAEVARQIVEMMMQSRNNKNKNGRSDSEFGPNGTDSDGDDLGSNHSSEDALAALDNAIAESNI